MGFYSKLAYKTSDVLYRNVFYRFGHGRPVTREDWEDAFKGDFWDFIEKETARYHAIDKFYRKFKPNGSVLDVGCGKGGLYQYLKKGNPSFEYMGVDISENATKAAAERFSGVPFQQLDFDEDAFTKKFDIVIFNEVIEFFKRPVKTLEKCRDINLNPGGGIIISMFQGHDALWKLVDKSHNVLDEEEVQNEEGKKWRIKLLTPR